jgi:hypothetical protein
VSFKILLLLFFKEFCYVPSSEANDMGRFEQVALAKSEVPLASSPPCYDPSVKSRLTDAQNEELRVILSQPIEIASHAEMIEVFENWGD